LSEAFALCPALVLVPSDPVAVAEAAETLVRRIEDLGAPVEPTRPGRVLIATVPIERLYGGRAGVLVRLQDCAPSARVGAAPGRFSALAATRRARPGRPVIISPPAIREFLAPLPLATLVEDGGVDETLVASLTRLGINRLGALEALGRIALRDRFGPGGVYAWQLAAGVDPTPLAPREPLEPMRETLAFSDPAMTRGALEHALRVLVERLMQHPHRHSREPRLLRLDARLVGGGSWSCAVVLREPTADPARLRLALAAKIDQLPAPVVELAIEVMSLAEANRQDPLLMDADGARARRLADAVGHVRASLGEGAALHVVAVDTESRLPERRYGLAPR
jgi:protein ImuB